MTPKQALVMQKLCACSPGKGVMLSLPDHPIAINCIDKGWCYSINGGLGDVFIATEAGRQAYHEATFGKWNLP